MSGRMQNAKTTELNVKKILKKIDVTDARALRIVNNIKKYIDGQINDSYEPSVKNTGRSEPKTDLVIITDKGTRYPISIKTDSDAYICSYYKQEDFLNTLRFTSISNEGMLLAQECSQYVGAFLNNYSRVPGNKQTTRFLGEKLQKELTEAKLEHYYELAKAELLQKFKNEFDSYHDKMHQGEKDINRFLNNLQSSEPDAYYEFVEYSLTGAHYFPAGSDAIAEYMVDVNSMISLKEYARQWADKTGRYYRLQGVPRNRIRKTQIPDTNLIDFIVNQMTLTEMSIKF